MKHDKNDLLRRQDCIDAIEGITCSMSLCVNADECHGMKRMQRQAVLEIANMPSVQPDHVADSGKKVCVDTISRQAALKKLAAYIHLIDKTMGKGTLTDDDCMEAAKSVLGEDELPAVQPEWNNHTVACLLAELFNDTCACNYNDIDEWLPEKCELLDSCPNPVGVACWEQFLKHRAERRTDG